MPATNFTLIIHHLNLRYCLYTRRQTPIVGVWLAARQFMLVAKTQYKMDILYIVNITSPQLLPNCSFIGYPLTNEVIIMKKVLKKKDNLWCNRWFCRFYIVKFILVEPRTTDTFTEFHRLLLCKSLIAFYWKYLRKSEETLFFLTINTTTPTASSVPLPVRPVVSVPAQRNNIHIYLDFRSNSRVWLMKFVPHVGRFPALCAN